MNATVFLIVTLAALAHPAPPALPSCPAVPAQGGQLYCCIAPSGQQCCAQLLDSSGAPAGCGCSP